MKKRYGDTKTHLTLTATAREAYDSYSPLSIWERETDDDETEYRYDISGCLEATDLTETEVNEMLESLLRDDDAEAAADAILEAGLFDAAVSLMDDDIRESVHADYAPCSDKTFLAVYCMRHYDKYGETFTVN